jgi:non-specific serine/threonine protein kinase
LLVELTAGHARRHNLPAPLTRFVGRQRELATIQDLLGKTRLLTLTGAGGVGKTRLALEVAHRLLDRYRDGVWLIDLAPLSDPSLVPLAISTALDLRERPGEPVATTLLTFLEGRQPLLILVNCEHLAEACGPLVRDVLETCPGVSILATSRQSLRLTGETAFRVPSLPTPTDPPFAAERILSCDAARLFVERARAVRPDLVLTPEAAFLIGQICRRLDGIPLALELAAARLSALTVEQIVRRLDQQFSLLTVGDPTALPRHRTLRATLDWSYALLSDPERWLWRRLAVFAGGFTLEAAELSCGRDGVTASDVADLVSQLVDKSLVVMDEHSGEARSRLLEPLRQYAWEKLEEAGEVKLARDRHRDWCLDLVERAGQGFNSPARKHWANHLNREIDNLRAALGWCAANPEGVRVGLTIASILDIFWTRHGHLNEGRQHLASLLARAGEAVDARVRYEALRVAGHLAQLASAYAEAEVLLRESLALWRQSRASPADLGPLFTLGAVLCNLDDFAEARAVLDEYRANARAVGNVWEEARATSFLGIVAKRESNLDLSVELHEESLRLFSHFNVEGISTTDLFELGAIAALRGDQVRARSLFQESLAVWARLDDRTGIAMSMMGLSWVASALDRPERAARLSGAAAALRDTAGLGIWGSHRDQDEESTSRAKLALGDAVWQSVRNEGRALSLDQAIAYALDDNER